MTQATSPYLNRPLRSEREAREERHCKRRLRNIAERFEDEAARYRNGGFDMNAEARAGAASEEAFAVRWALRRLAEIEREMHERISGGRT